MEPIDRLNTALEDRYSIERELGEGGMATVYLADDLRHGRKVAIKVLRPELAAVVGGERFLAEIKTTANLQHPHILPLFDSGEADGFLFYVMPHVEGETLRDRLDREKQLPVDEAVRIATDVAEGLQAAHDEGVIHRDIKPANILMSRGRPLVADFGIALAVSAAGAGRLTETGLSMGTPSYMSPEQASADREPSPASDVYSLGCVLYEMLVGDPPHTAGNAQAVLAKILTEKPRPPTGLRPAIPPNVDAAIRKALEKLPADRFQRAKDFADALTNPRFVHGGAHPSDLPASRRRVTAAHAAVAVLLGGLAAWGWLRPVVESGVGGTAVRSTLADFEFSQNTDYRPVMARDGSFIVVHGPDEEAPFYLRRVDRTRFDPIEGTEGGTEAAPSPDGEWLAFRRADQILRIPISGGTAVPLARGFDAHWGLQDRIVFGGIDGLIYSISPQGGDPVRLQAEDEEARGSHPHLLPDGRRVVFSAVARGPDGEADILHALDVASGRATSLGVEGQDPVYVPTGHLLYSDRRGNLMAMSFDAKRGEPTGAPFVVATDVLNQEVAGEIAFSVSHVGTAVYLQAVGTDRELVEVAPGGRETTIPLEPDRYRFPRYSPDGRVVAYEAGEEIWLFDRVTGSSERLTTEGGATYPVWSADGSYVYYAGRVARVSRRRADRSEGAEVVLGGSGFVFPQAALPSGDGLVLNQWRGAERGVDITIMSVGDDGASVRDYLSAGHHEAGGHVSPDGEWIVYASDESGERKLYIRRLPDATGQVALAEDASDLARWAPDGSAVLWMRNAPDGTELLRAPVTADDAGLRVGRPQRVLLVEGAVPTTTNFPARNWDVSPDGQRFVFVVDRSSGGGSGRAVKAEIVVNWFAELRALSGE